MNVATIPNLDYYGSMQRIKSGIENFDNIIGGGFPKGRTCIVSGGPGVGKSIFCLQFLLEGLKNDEKAVYICMDEKPVQIIENAKSIGFNMLKYLESGKLQIFDITSYFSISHLGDFDAIQVVKAIEDIMSFVKESGAKRLVIDPIEPLIFFGKPLSLIVQYIRSLVFNIEEYGECTALLTSYVKSDSTLDSLHGIVEFVVPGIISLRMEKHDDGIKRFINVKKLRAVDINLLPYEFNIINQKGIVIS